MAKTPQNDTETTTPSAADTAASGKGKATPTRKEQEAARRQPLVPTDRKLAAKQSRAQVNSERERARIGMANGEERYLPLRDKGPQKRWVRDYVDARFSIGEILLPLLVLVILSYFFEAIAAYVLLGVWAIIAVVVGEGIIVGQIITSKLKAKFGSVDRGVRWYAFMRMIQLRPLRLPKPQVKRGQKPAGA